MDTKDSGYSDSGNRYLMKSLTMRGLFFIYMKRDFFPHGNFRWTSIILDELEKLNINYNSLY